ncbi:MAG: DMT family transporter [Bacteroidia bacterium]
MIEKANKYVQLHIIIFIWGLTPVLGKLISLTALPLVWWRLLISAISLYVYARFKGVSLKCSTTDFTKLIGWGFVVGIHWFFFYQAIKVSNVSIALAGYSTTTLFGSFLQPIVLKKKFFWGDIVYGIIITAAIFIIFNFETDKAVGLFYGIGAAFTAALFSVFNGRFIKRLPSTQITLIEFAGAFAIINIFMMLNHTLFDLTLPNLNDIIYLLILSIVCTTLAFTWSVEILKKIDPLTIIVTNNLELIYGVIISLILFGQSEYMSAGFYLGAAILLLSVFSYPFIKAKFKKL